MALLPPASIRSKPNPGSCRLERATEPIGNSADIQFVPLWNSKSQPQAHLRPFRLLRRRLRDESGQTIVLAALCMTILLGMVGLAVDAGFLFNAKRRIQIAADSAALAGAAEMNFGDSVAAARTAATLNGFTNGVNGVTVQVNPSGTSSPSPLYGAYKNQSGYLEVIVTAPTPTVFMRVMNLTSFSVTARAVGALGGSSACIYVLSTSGTSFSLSNNAQLTASTCGILIDSSGAPGISVSGSANVTAASVGVVGTAYTDNSGSTITPSAIAGITPFSDPLAFLTPPSYSAASCTADPLSHYNNGGSSYAVGPGSTYSNTQSGNLVCYNSLSIGINNDTVTLNSGIYVITGALTFASGLAQGGQGVTFYLTGTGSLSIANNANPTLKAPTSGSYNGILFYQDRSDTQAASIQGGACSTMEGILYFPNAALSIGNGTSTTIAAPMVAKTITIVGGSRLQDNSYSSLNPNSPLSSARLVE